MLGCLLRGHKLAYFVVSLDICGRIGACGASYRILIYKHHVRHTVEIARKLAETPRRITLAIYSAAQCPIENIAHKRRLARTAYAGNHRKHIERELCRHVLEVMLCGAFHPQQLAHRAP